MSTFARMYRSVDLAKVVRLGVCLSLGAVTVSATSVNAGNTTYQYDVLGRVIKVTYPDSKQICYDYDPAGNRTSVKRQATGTCTATGSVLVLPSSQATTQSTDQQEVALDPSNEASADDTTTNETALSF